MSDPADPFRAAVLAELGNAPEHPGDFHRFSTNGKPGNRYGWCAHAVAPVAPALVAALLLGWAYA